MKTWRIYIICVSILAALAGTTLAEGPKPADAPSYKYVEVRADKTRYKYGDSEIAILTGNVKITQGDTVLTADKIEYNENEDIQTAVATGSVKIVDPDAEITGDKGIAYFNEKRAVIDGNIKVVAKLKPKPAEKDKKTIKSEWKDKAVITCDKIEYFYKKKEASAVGNLKMIQKDRTLTAGQAFYQVKPEIITLSGGVKGRDSKGQTFSAPGKVTASIKDGDEWIEMEHAVGTFRIKEEKDEAENPPSKETPTTTKIETKTQ